jgi:hypothetical protein
MNKPAWFLTLPKCAVRLGDRVVSARYMTQSGVEKRRGVVAVWLNTDHPYADPARGTLGSALMLPARDVVPEGAKLSLGGVPVSSPGAAPDEPATSQTFDGVYEALRRQFGSAAEIEWVSRESGHAVFGFTVDGVDYSLTVNVTP